MKIYNKLLSTLLLLFGFGLVSCDFANNSNSVSNNSSNTNDKSLDIDVNELKTKYGEFKVTTEKGNEGILSSDGKTYTISVSSSKSAYTVSGYFEGRIIINNANGLSSIKGVELTLNNACLVSNAGATIDYQVDEKNVEIVAKKSTENFVINTSDGYNDHAINSEKNIEVDGKGVLNILTKTGHGLRAKKKIRFYDATTINITSGHDAIHTSEFVANNEEELEKDYEAFTGTLNVLSAVSQAFDCTTNIGTGFIDLTSGKYNITNCESVFKTDYSLVIGGEVIANNLTSEPVVRGDNSNGITIEITDNGSFIVNGENYTEIAI